MTFNNSSDRRSMLKASLNGFTSAHERFEAASATAEELFISLSGALWWAVSVDDGFEDLAGNDQSYRPNLGDYREARDNDNEGQFIRALRYARNRCGHQRALMTSAWLPGVAALVPKGDGLPLICWRTSADLPSPDPRFESKTLRAEYDRLLGGWPADEALCAAKVWFKQEQVRAQL
jgi:hypothetical protein